MDHDVDSAIRRLITIAGSDTGQSRRTADFLLAWWNGADLGHFPIEHLWNVDRAISADMVTILGYLASQPSAVYPTAFGLDDAMRALIEHWRPGVLAAQED
jgi:hypothetical protein